MANKTIGILKFGTKVDQYLHASHSIARGVTPSPPSLLTLSGELGATSQPPVLELPIPNFYLPTRIDRDTTPRSKELQLFLHTPETYQKQQSWGYLIFLSSKVIGLQSGDLEKVYVHRSLLDAHRKTFGNCLWWCFPTATIMNFAEYLYQGDYTVPLPATAVQTAHDGSSGCSSTSDGRHTNAPARKAQPSGSGILSISENLGYERVFLTHAELFILSRERGILPLANMCLGRLGEAMEEAKGTIKESVFSENMRALILYSYYPCCSGNDPVWEELQKTVSGFLASKKGWILEAPGSDLISGQEKLLKDLLTSTIKLVIDADERLAAAEKQVGDLKLEREVAPKLGNK
ncbi:hypothetical protein HOY82DRAFT_540403 [Tuber indicum]|nr:hypothetical protein HOY82DRAFT_540403 [Tuber indicum]